MQATRSLYYFLVAAVTQLLLALGALVLSIPGGLLRELPLHMLALLMVYNVLVSTLVAALVGGDEQQDWHAVLRATGLVLGHIVGVVFGGVAGAYYGGAVWAVVGAVALYFVAGWIGSRVSLAVGETLQGLVTPAERAARRPGRPERLNAQLLFFYGAVVPLLFMTAASLIQAYDVQVGHYQEALPLARLALILLSLLSMAIPWIRRAQALRGRQPLLHEPVVSIMGMALCLAPAIFGFLLFVGFGLSMAELSLFAAAASLATTLWGVNRA